MSHRICNVNAYDIFGDIHVTVRIWDMDDESETRSSTEFSTAATVPGIGATEPNHWLEHALMTMLEGL